jgi:hypothetical protein
VSPFVVDRPPSAPIATGTALELHPTEGDFPHVRRRSVKLACCTTTCCCIVLIGAAVGGLGGFITGIVKAVRINRLDREHYDAEELEATRLRRLARGTFRILVFAGAFAVVGVLMGIAAGFLVDKILGVY